MHFRAAHVRLPDRIDVRALCCYKPWLCSMSATEVSRPSVSADHASLLCTLLTGQMICAGSHATINSLPVANTAKNWVGEKGIGLVDEVGPGP